MVSSGLFLFTHDTFCGTIYELPSIFVFFHEIIFKTGFTKSTVLKLPRSRWPTSHTFEYTFCWLFRAANSALDSKGFVFSISQNPRQIIKFAPYYFECPNSCRRVFFFFDSIIVHYLSHGQSRLFLHRLGIQSIRSTWTFLRLARGRPFRSSLRKSSYIPRSLNYFFICHGQCSEKQLVFLRQCVLSCIAVLRVGVSFLLVNRKSWCCKGAFLV